MRPVFRICLLIFISGAVSAQDYNDYTTMLDNAESVVFTQPEEAIKIADHVLENTIDSHQLVRANLLNTAAFYLKGEYENSVKSAILAKRHAERVENISLQQNVAIATIPLLSHLGLDKVADQYYENTFTLSEHLKITGDSLLAAGGASLLAGYKNQNQSNWLEALEDFKEAKSAFEKIPNQIFVNETEAALVEITSRAYPNSVSQHYLNTILKDSSKVHPNLYLKMLVLSRLGILEFNNQDYNQSLELNTAALDISKRFNNKRFTSGITENLSSVYLAMQDIPTFYSYQNASDILEKEVDDEEDRAVNEIYNYINDNHRQKRDSIEDTYKRKLLILAALFVLLFLTRTLLKYRYRKRISQYQKFISYIESGKEQQDEQEQEEVVHPKTTSKGLAIPEQTEKTLMYKLKQFEKSTQFTRREMSLAQLAAHFETNTKYLSDVINTHKGKNFNSYINELRINYIIDKLKNEDAYMQYKISYLAEDCGFSSHSSFTTVFKTATGISPTVFIDLMKSRKKTEKRVYEEVE